MSNISRFTKSVEKEGEDHEIVNCLFEPAEGEDVVDITGWESKDDEECGSIDVRTFRSCYDSACTDRLVPGTLGGSR